MAIDALHEQIDAVAHDENFISMNGIDEACAPLARWAFEKRDTHTR